MFGVGRTAGSDPRYGIEAEVLVLDVSTLRPLAGPFPDYHAHPILAHLAGLPGWEPGLSAVGSPAVVGPSGGRVSLEPGGQVEYSSAPRSSVTGLLAEMSQAGAALEAAARAEGLSLVTRGIDPVNPVEAYPLAVGSERYVRLARHLARLGPAGARMMRQTISIQVNLSWGDEPLREWDVANRMAPYLLALFANSPRYGGQPTGHRSFRALQWRELDPARTGLPLDPDRPVETYLEFALGAGAILLGEPDEEARPFGEWLAEGLATVEDWESHLTTLFPEVRPRGYLEVRGLDALPVRWWAVPLAIVAGILRSPSRLSEVLAALEVPSTELLRRAGRLGLGDAEVAEVANWLWELGLEGCSRLPGEGWGSLADLARRFDAEVRRGSKGPGRGQAATATRYDPGAGEEPDDPCGSVPLARSVRSVR